MWNPIIKFRLTHIIPYQAEISTRSHQSILIQNQVYLKRKQKVLHLAHVFQFHHLLYHVVIGKYQRSANISLKRNPKNVLI